MFLEQLNARLSAKKQEEIKPSLSFNYVPTTSDLVQKFGKPGMHHGVHTQTN